MNQFKVPAWWNAAKAETYANLKKLTVIKADDGMYIESRYTLTKLNIPGSDKSFPGYVRLMLDWNGWDIPFFTKEQLTAVFAEFNEAGEGTLMKWDGDRAMHMDSASGEPNEWETIEPEEIEVDGQKITVYNMGCGLCWQEEEK
jgi:hypothetical protein